MTRAEHLEWCKKRALEYVDHGDCLNAMTSMLSDLGKHPDTKNSCEIGFMLMMTIAKHDVHATRRWITGFN